MGGSEKEWRERMFILYTCFVCLLIVLLWPFLCFPLADFYYGRFN